MRPHLQHIDNVPLLVPLFTDCTPESEYCGHGDAGSLAPSTACCQRLSIPWALEGTLVCHAGSKGTWAGRSWGIWGAGATSVSFLGSQK